MPRANPATSFEVAVRHFFRHLDNASELQRNPIVQRLFRPNVGLTERKQILTSIRQLIDDAASKYRKAAEPDEEAVTSTRLAIFYGSIEGTPVKVLADQFGLSQRQCYRERALMYRYVARFIQKCNANPASPISNVVSVFNLQMESASASAENGDYDQAALKYNSLIATGHGHQKANALIKRLDLELKRGYLDLAKVSLHELTYLFENLALGLPDAGSRAFSAYTALFSARLAWELGAFQEATARLTSAESASQSFHNDGSEALRGLYADIALESATRALDMGDFSASKAHLLRAMEADRSTGATTGRSASIALTKAVLAFVMLRPGASEEQLHQKALVRNAQTVALKSRSLESRLHMEIFLAVLQRTSAEALQRGAVVLSIARNLRNPRLYALLSLEVADLLLDSPFWGKAKRVMSIGSFVSGSFVDGSFSALQSIYYLRLRAFAKATKFALRLDGIARRASCSRLQGVAFRSLAAASHERGDFQKAKEYVLAALELTEQYGTAAACLKAYRSAALITGEPHYARKAHELASAIEQSM